MADHVEDDLHLDADSVGHGPFDDIKLGVVVLVGNPSSAVPPPRTMKHPGIVAV